ncbi:MAG: hypothetical protein ACRD3Q_02240 [Terriglobales bacterium]
MSNLQCEDGAPVLPPKGIALAIEPKYIAEYWSRVEPRFREIEAFTLLLASDDIHRWLLSGQMRLFGVLDQTGQAVPAIARVVESARGAICRLWLLASHSDAASAGALLDEVEVFARQHSCVALEINAHPDMARHFEGRPSAVVFERDLRLGLRVN